MISETWRSLYPFPSHWTDVGDPPHRYHYLDQGQGDPLLMVHGNPTWSFYWRRLIQHYEGRFRVVAPDHLGSGLSDKPADYSYRLQGHIDNLVHLVDQLDLRQVTMLGHDWGGAIGLGAALARPNRFQRFVLFNTGAFPPHFIPWRIRLCRTPLLGRVALQGMNLFSRAALWMAVHDPSRLTPEARAGLLAPYDRWSNRIGVYGFVQDIPATPAHSTWHTLQRIEAGLSTLADRPWQLIWGMRDWCFRPSCIERFRQHLPNADVDTIEDAGHWVVEEAHERIVERLDRFLAVGEK